MAPPPPPPPKTPPPPPDGVGLDSEGPVCVSDVDSECESDREPRELEGLDSEGDGSDFDSEGVGAVSESV